ncbi:MAG: hypothetical protein V3U16_03665 [Candidatus Neomarinimicrobiota bacterium]
MKSIDHLDAMAAHDGPLKAQHGSAYGINEPVLEALVMGVLRVLNGTGLVQEYK